MAQYKLLLALPQSAPGSTEFHYGHLCTIKNDGVYIELPEIDAKNFLRGRLIQGPVILDEVVESAAKEVIESKAKRGPKANPKVETPSVKFDTPINDELRRLAEEL